MRSQRASDDFIEKIANFGFRYGRRNTTRIYSSRMSSMSRDIILKIRYMISKIKIYSHRGFEIHMALRELVGIVVVTEDDVEFQEEQ